MNAGDVLARWMGETRTGSLATFKTKFRWLASTTDVRPHDTEPGRWLRDAAALGTVEVDWAAGNWAAAPVVLTHIPAGDGLLLLCGPRTSLTERLLDQGDIAIHTIEQPGSVDQLPRPSALLVQYDPGENLNDLGAMVGAVYVTCAAEQLADLLPSLSPGAVAAPPATDQETLEFLDPPTLRWRLAAPYDRRVGAYRYTVLGRSEYRWFEGDEWRRADMSVCVFLSLRRARLSALRWRREGPHSRTGQLFVDWGAPLPPLQQRAAVLCTGLTPRFAAGAKTATYENVPRGVAQRIAASLHQQLDDA